MSGIKRTVGTDELMEIDKKILEIDKVICRHLDSASDSKRGLISQDILSQLRNFVEHLMLKFYAKGNDIENTYKNICEAIQYVKTQGKLRILREFHSYLQIVVSHYTLNEENSERLMMKYYEYLLKIKKLVYEEFSLNVLGNLHKFPLNTDTDLQEYYKKIATRIKLHNAQSVGKSEKYYIKKIKPFFVGEEIYYEVTFTSANDYTSKFNRVIAFTRLDIMENYSVKLTLINDSIHILGKKVPIIIIVGWEVSIRDCEFKNFTSLIRGEPVKTGYSEQKGISQFLTTSGFNLTELIDFPNNVFKKVKQIATKQSKSIIFFDDLERCREILSKNYAGSNLIRYLLYHMNNKIIKKQRDTMPNKNVSSLYVKNKCIPFDNIPFNFSLVEHNPRLRDLFACIDSKERQHELLARLVRNNTEINGEIFTSINDVVGFNNIGNLVRTYNKSLWGGHFEKSKLVIENGQIFINGYKNDVRFIVEELKKLSKNGVENYLNFVTSWLNKSGYYIDCNEKKKILKGMFENSYVALIYGSAGTGKSTLINHISHLFADKNKLLLAQTNPAVDNLKRRVKASNCYFTTISKFMYTNNIVREYDLLIIDECSTVSNDSMRKILNKVKYKLLVLVGDTYQINSINFGNWFSVARSFIPKSSIFELIKPYRTKEDSSLFRLWNRVRNMNDNILEIIVRNNYSSNLNESIFQNSDIDEVILCLNYDGLYGINNINRFLQESNPNAPVDWGIQQYKVNDPILFNESNRFAPVIYNNMKGRIKRIEIIDSEKPSERIQFDIEIDRAISGVDAFDKDFELLDSTEKGNSVIRFCVNKLNSTDEDDDSLMVVVPFQVAYAISIHKAQGLEYKSVKIVITDEVDELITHNIFYTAITRAREKLRIFWSPEVEKRVLANIKPRENFKDISLLKKYMKNSG